MMHTYQTQMLRQTIPQNSDHIIMSQNNNRLLIHVFALFK